MNTKNLKIQTDNQLVAQAQKGHKSAFGELYIRYYSLVFNKCLSFAKNTSDAADLAQDVMVKVLRRVNTFKGEAKFATWLYSVTFNHCTDTIRKLKGKQVESLEAVFHLVDSSELELEMAKEKEVKEDTACKALMTISIEERQLLLMKYLSKKSILELQGFYNLSASAVKMRLKRSRAKVVLSYESFSSSSV
jgi:RNA polymerase sigma factor (sigma-70 family)